MRRNRLISRARQHADADTLAKLASRLSESATRIEDQLWERRLVELVNDRLARGFDDAIEMVSRGEITDAKTILLLQHVALKGLL